MEFLSTPSGWRATKVLVLRKLLELFLSTPSGWRATGIPCKINTVLFDFYPRPPGGGRPPYPIFSGTVCLFLSTPSGWRATFPPDRHTLNSEISIHALRVEGDAKCVSPEADVCIFLSTPSGWRATMSPRKRGVGLKYFYPRPPGGGRRTTAGTLSLRVDISIHALRVEGDRTFGRARPVEFYFYPRPPGGGRLLERRANNRLPHFYPRPLGGGRPTQTITSIAPRN